jgi:inosine-uridine nucleoside N-ribohydrolase
LTKLDIQPGATSRRGALALLCAGAVAAQAGGAWAYAPPLRSRVIVDNDLSGDPDGLVHLAHQLLSPTSDVRAIIASHLPVDLPFDIGPTGSAPGVAKTRELLKVMKREDRYTVLGGADRPITDPTKVERTPAADFIIKEALRTDTDLPLYYAAGAGLTDLATAWLLEPRIGKKVTLVWIGGDYADLSPQPSQHPEFNTTIDKVAARVIFEQSDIAIWQVPKSTYASLIISHAELDQLIRPCGALGAYLVGQLEGMLEKMPMMGQRGGETFTLGDSPLVLLTALQSAFDPDTNSSRYELRKAPRVTPEGRFADRPDGRLIRVYTSVDIRLTIADLLAKLQRAA